MQFHFSATCFVLVFALPVIHGYYKADRPCMSSDECENAVCVQFPFTGLRTCLCEHGYYKKDFGDKKCKDIDECSVFNNICGYGSCNNKKGSYECTCFPPAYPLFGNTSCFHPFKHMEMPKFTFPNIQLPKPRLQKPWVWPSGPNTLLYWALFDGLELF